jgi:hypothetical protein
VSFVFQGDISSFNATRFLYALAFASGTDVSALYIMSISSASIQVKVGVLPTAQQAITGLVSSTTTTELSHSLGYVLVSEPSVMMAQSTPPSSGRSVEGGLIAGVVIGALMGISIAGFGAYKCWQGREPSPLLKKAGYGDEAHSKRSPKSPPAEHSKTPTRSEPRVADTKSSYRGAQDGALVVRSESASTFV